MLISYSEIYLIGLFLYFIVLQFYIQEVATTF